MTDRGDGRQRGLLWQAVCAGCLVVAGCGDQPSNPGLSGTRSSPAAGDSFRGAAKPAENETPARVDEPADSSAQASVDSSTAPGSETQAAATTSLPKDRTFTIDSEGAHRVGFDDVDLLKVIAMDPVTTDCVEKMPGWLRDLNGKKVRIRGYMKPGFSLTGIPRFTFVRDTGLCCFGPKGKIYDLINVTLKEGTTTEYIELRPFDVVGTFRIDLREYDGEIAELYWIDDAAIHRK